MTLISFKHRFVFIKTTKVAGTSMEIALSRFCGPDDVMSNFIGGPSSNKLRMQYYPYPVCNRVREWATGKKRDMIPHMGVKAIKRIIGNKIYKHLLKISVIRNPYDWVVSLYAWEHRNTKRFVDRQRLISASHFRTWFMEHDEKHKMAMNRNFCTLKAPYDGIDVIIRFEHFEEDLLALSSRLGFQDNIYDTFRDIREKGSVRPKSLTTRPCFEGFDEGIKKVQRLFALELEKFGYDLPWVPQGVPQGLPQKLPQKLPQGLASEVASGVGLRRCLM